VLREIIDEIDGLEGTNDDKKFFKVEKGFKQVNLNLTQLSKAWKVIYFPFFSSGKTNQNKNKHKGHRFLGSLLCDDG